MGGVELGEGRDMSRSVTEAVLIVHLSDAPNGASARHETVQRADGGHMHALDVHEGQLHDVSPESLW